MATAHRQKTAQLLKKGASQREATMQVGRALLSKATAMMLKDVEKDGQCKSFCYKHHRHCDVQQPGPVRFSGTKGF
eukprot:83565-Lingulodinium_polyedra.AAC.1